MNAIVVLLAAGCASEAVNETELAAPAAFVHVAPAALGVVERTLELTGTIEAGRAVDLVPDVPGKVERLPVRVGDRVEKGQLLAQLDIDMAVLQGEQAEAARRLAELGLETAQREFARAEKLHQGGSLTDQQFEQARAALQMAEQQLAQAAAMKGLAAVQVQGGRLVAPFAGVVSAVSVEEGEYFNPMTASPLTGTAGLVSLVDMDRVRVDLQVADRDVGRLQAGMSAHLFVDALGDAAPAGGIEAAVETVGLVADPSSRTFPVRVTADNATHLVRPGMHARVRLVLDRKTDVVVVPDEAVREAEGTAFVMVAADGHAARRDVQTGLDGDQGVEIAAGLSPGDPVIVDGNFGLPDGAAIAVVE